MSADKQNIKISRRTLILTGTTVVLTSPIAWTLLKNCLSQKLPFVEWTFLGPIKDNSILLEKFKNSWVEVNKVGCWQFPSKKYVSPCLIDLDIRFSDPNIQKRGTSSYDIQMIINVTDMQGKNYQTKNEIIKYYFIPFDFAMRGKASVATFGGPCELPVKFNNIGKINVKLIKIPFTKSNQISDMS
jgi:hypothetical protein